MRGNKKFKSWSMMNGLRQRARVGAILKLHQPKKVRRCRLREQCPVPLGAATEECAKEGGEETNLQESAEVATGEEDGNWRRRH
jgi:hypothetical protein